MPKGIYNRNPFSKESKDLMRKIAIKNGNKPPIHKGKNHWKWKGGITSEQEKERHSIEFRLWREAVFARDNWICQICKKRGKKLHPHHIQNFSQYPELRFAIDNGITFCDKCHILFHKIFGKQNNNQEQIMELKKEYEVYKKANII